jgi:hypothetical protein
MTFAPVQNRLGVQPVGTTVTCVNKSGTSVAIGDLVITSFIHAGVVVNPEQAANTGYVFNCIRKAVSTETGNTGYLGVVTGLMTGAGDNGREVQVQFGGICSAKVLVTATVTPGTLLSVSATAGVLTNAVTASEYSVTLMDNAAVADGTALKRVYIPQEYTFGTTNSAVPGVYGSRRVGQFLRDVTTQTDSVDIIMVGDSNTNIDGWGWADGFNFALQTYTSAVEYATPITPTSSWNGVSYYGVYAANGLYSRIPTPPAAIVNPTGSPALGGTLVSGKASGPAQLTALMTRGTGDLQPNTSPFDYGWIAGAVEFADPFSGVTSYQDSTRLSWSQLAIRYRVVHGKGPSMGTLRLGARLDEEPYTTIGTTSIVCNQTSYEWVTSELVLTANSARTNKPIAYAFAANNFDPSCKITGPMAIALNSICTPRKGYSVTSMNHHGGATMSTVASNVVQAATIVRQYLKEARSRQTACEGSGRVIVCIQGGINDDGNPWGPNATTFFEQCATEWAALGYPSSDLAFLGFVSHQDVNPDDMTAERSSAIALATSSPQYTIVNIPTFVSYNDMTYGGGSNVSWFRGPTESPPELNHLSESGYKAISGRIITRLLATA